MGGGSASRRVGDDRRHCCGPNEVDDRGHTRCVERGPTLVGERHRAVVEEVVDGMPVEVDEAPGVGLHRRIVEVTSWPP